MELVEDKFLKVEGTSTSAAVNASQKRPGSLEHKSNTSAPVAPQALASNNKLQPSSYRSSSPALGLSDEKPLMAIKPLGSPTESIAPPLPAPAPAVSSASASSSAPTLGSGNQAPAIASSAVVSSSTACAAVTALSIVASAALQSPSSDALRTSSAETQAYTVSTARQSSNCSASATDAVAKESSPNAPPEDETAAAIKSLNADLSGSPTSMNPSAVDSQLAHMQLPELALVYSYCIHAHAHTLSCVNAFCLNILVGLDDLMELFVENSMRLWRLFGQVLGAVYSIFQTPLLSFTSD